MGYHYHSLPYYLECAVSSNKCHTNRFLLDQALHNPQHWTALLTAARELTVLR